MSTQNPTEEEPAGTARITEHVESPAQGGARYVRCEVCGRELLMSMGGAEALPHADECALGGAF